MAEYILSEAQREIIQLEEYYENTSINNIAGIVNIKDNVKISEIDKSLNNLIKTHESYRIKIKKVNSEYKQYIDEYKSKEFDYIDFNNNQKGFDEWVNTQVKANIFALNSDLFKFVILTLPKGDVGILLLQHHVISDGWSMTIAGNTLCESLIYGNENKNENFEYTYLDCVKDEMNYKNSSRFEKDKQFWFEKTENLEDNELFEKKRVNNAQGDRLNYRLSDTYTHKIMEFCESNKLSISNLFSAAMLILKYKKTLANKNSIGIALHNRNKQFEKKMTGVYSRVLPIIVEIDKKSSINEFLGTMKKETFKVLKHRKFPNSYIVENSGNAKGLLDFVVSFQNTQHNPDFIKKGYSEEWLDSGTTNAPLGLNISNRHGEDKLEIDYDYQVDVVSKKEVVTLHTNIIEILNVILENPRQKISEIEIITEEEKSLILHDFNNTQVALNNNQTFVEYFEQQVEKTPEKKAITYEGKSLTYQALNAKANQVAHQLRHEGVKPNRLVGIMTNRHLEMIIGIYGILKAGGAYVPIDPNYPTERINYILNDSNPHTLLTDRILDTSIEFNQTVINLMENISTSIQPTEDLSRVTDVSNLLCVIYTSGTTGKPKGVMVPYKGVMNNLNRRIKRFDISSDDNILFKMPFTFDPSIWEIFGWAMVGAQATLLPSGEEGDPETITSLIQTSKVTIAVFVPSMFNPFINYIKSTKQAHLLSSLSYVLVGGEAVKPELVNQFNEAIGKKNNTQLINVYGPTETTIDVTNFDCENNVIYEAIPIGQPIANTQAYIMNEDNNLMGIGTPGELCIGGAGVTDGYLNRPQLTKEKFIDNPFGEGKLYRTGDLVKWQEDGNITCLGRIDDQVKIRGYRIELGEIESTLRQNEDIIDVAVIANPMGGEELAICAYLVSDKQIPFDDIKTKLSAKLPNYMVPSYLAQIEKLPVTSNGKLNIKQLPEIKIESKSYVAPRNNTEVMLTKIFENVLNIERVSIDDNFFEMGGHSLKAISVINEIESEIGVRLPLKIMFDYEKVIQLAKVIDDYDSDAHTQSIPQAETKPYYLASSPQKRLYILNEMIDNQTAYNMPGMFEIQGSVDVKRVENTFQKLVERHEALRTHFETINGTPVQVLEDDITISVDYEDTLNVDYDTLSKDFVKPFNLAKAPLLRVKLVKIAAQRYMLLFDIHHIISDGFSITLFMKEFSKLYQDHPLEKLKVQYKDYSEWMHSHDLSNQRAFWLSQFEDKVPVLDLPCDYTRSDQQSFEGRTITVNMPKETKIAISQLSQATGSTDYMILLTSFMTLLHKYSRQEDIVIGSPISGRIHKDTQGVFGMFVNTLAMRGYPEGHKSFHQLLAEIKDLSLKAFDNQEYPLEALVEEVVDKRDLTRNPLFDVMFTLQNNDYSTFTVNDWSVNQKELSTSSAKVDLNMSVVEDNGYKISLEFSDKLFNQATVKRMLEHYLEILSNSVQNPEQKISDIEMITKEERKTLLHDFNDTQVDLNNSQTFVSRFETQVAKTPNKMAVTYEGESLTYQTLNAKANQVAHKLRHEGVKPNSLISIMTNRHLEMIIGIYGILKAGGAYVPIDPNYPSDRINYILNDSKPIVLLTDQPIDHSIVYNGVIIDVTDQAMFEELPTDNLLNVTDVSDLMYVIYTSGTTGKPKGVMVSNEGVMNRLNWMINQYNIGEKDVILFKTPFTFDVSVWEIFGFSLVGAQLTLLPSGEEGNPEKINSLLQISGITIVHFVPSMFNAFITYIESTKQAHLLSSLRYILASGEALKTEWVNQFNESIGNENRIQLINLYGPTETTVEVTHFDCENNVIYEEIPIGQPIANIQAYIMNSDKNLMGIGVPGELCIGGVGVTRGYLNRPDLTSEKFVDNPFGEGKLYRTGDLAKWSATGDVEYLGRLDEQVKIRGYRIELGEIESLLRQIDFISDVAVVAKPMAGEELAICAYLVSDEQIDFYDIKTQLSEKLPNYMVPSYMTQIDGLPLSSSGKLDKKQLPDIKVKSKAYAAPTNNTEVMLTHIFENVLEIERVSIDDNFFEIGGHSLKAIGVINEIESEIGVRLPLKIIFERPTVLQLAEVIKNSTNDKNIQDIPKAEDKPFYYISPIQQHIYIK
ncbi:amino acid adenylation domain-containing protein [Staphylococcus equorum]|uniref:Putative long chain fatty acid-CoA ligase VraA n=1 Tax=Staphylococcus equorum TaxID=246432 RepID=A0A9X4LD14_9STAP|nr:non-ribosomal peptide synthetase [Staphylococcus equorum]MDG0842076.1 amino acid adenylation domain-containing protein [Staphylococcus equorum]MDG0857873.1 amino acid adenylation domain-containing protein [Staphylococcus equorum]